MADLENGLYSGINAGYNGGDQSITSHYVTAMVKGGPNLWAIKAGNAQSGGLTTIYSGSRPNASGYNPMKKQGAIILTIAVHYSFMRVQRLKPRSLSAEAGVCYQSIGI